MTEHFKKRIMDILSVEKLWEYGEDTPKNAIHICIHDASTTFSITYSMLEHLSHLLQTKEISFESSDNRISEVTPDSWRRVSIKVSGVRFPVSVNEATKRIILDVVHDFVISFLSEDRRGDEELPLGAIEEAVKQGIIGIDDMTLEFSNRLYERLEGEL